MTEYEVHLVDTVSPLHTGDLEFYDSGVWIAREESRVFYPYDRIERIVDPDGSGSSGDDEAQRGAGTEGDVRETEDDRMDLE